MKDELRQSVLDTLDMLGKDYNSYTLPYVKDPTVQQVLPISGGRDSKACALIVVALNPNVDFIGLFTDTKAEPKDTYKELDQLEQMLGIKIHRVTPDLGLYDILDENGGYLPAPNARWCTSRLKLEIADQFIEDLLRSDDAFRDIKQFHFSVGIRADEDRIGHVTNSDSLTLTSFPMMSLGLSSRDVSLLLTATGVGIPKTYLYRRRSGCESCFFMSKAERIQSLIWNPAGIKRAAQYETLSHDETSYVESLISHQHFSKKEWINLAQVGFYQAPGATNWTVNDVERRKPLRPVDQKSANLSLFSDNPDVLWIAIGFVVHPLMAMFDPNHHGVSMQKILGISTTRGGLSRTLAFTYKHLSETTNLQFCEDDLSNLRIAVYQLRFSGGVIPTKELDQGSFVWSTDKISTERLELITKACHHTLIVEGLKQEHSRYKEISDTKTHYSWESERCEHIESELERLDSINHSLGDITFTSLWQPPADIDAYLAKAKKSAKKRGEAEGLNPCVACSV